jgi:hypothetical protein
VVCMYTYVCYIGFNTVNGIHVMRMDENHITKRVTNVNVDGHPSRGRPKKRWMGCVKDVMRIKGVSMDVCIDDE